MISRLYTELSLSLLASKVAEYYVTNTTICMLNTPLLARFQLIAHNHEKVIRTTVELGVYKEAKEIFLLLTKNVQS